MDACSLHGIGTKIARGARSLNDGVSRQSVEAHCARTILQSSNVATQTCCFRETKTPSRPQRAPSAELLRGVLLMAITMDEADKIALAVTLVVVLVAVAFALG